MLMYDPMKAKPEQPKEGGTKREKLSLHGLSIEDAIRAAARTGPPATAPKTRRRKPKARKGSS